MRKYLIIIFLSCLLFLNIGNNVNAVIIPRALGNDERIKVINYRPNAVVRFIAHYTYHSIIEFENGEIINNISMGTPTSWQIHPEGNKIFIKPVSEDATTNMIVITDKRMYFFEMHAEQATNIEDPKLSFITKFLYPNEQSDTFGAETAASTTSNPANVDLSHAENYNFKYKVSGKARNIEPVLLFDDGEFTYFKFRGKNTEFPAIYIVDRFGNEGIVNYRMASGYVVVERVHDRFTLRHGKDTLCVFNESFAAVPTSPAPL